MKEPEPAGNDFAFPKSLLRCIFAFLSNIFDARERTIMVMVELMQSSEIPRITKSELVGILDDIFT